MSEGAISIKKGIHIVVVAWILSLITTFGVLNVLWLLHADYLVI